MVVCPQPEAAESGVDILRAGGNAVDAAVACALAQTVVDPLMCGIAARAGTSPQVIEKLNAASQVFLKDPAVVQKLQSLQVLPMPGGSGELMRLTVRDTAKWQQAIGDLDLNVKQ